MNRPTLALLTVLAASSNLTAGPLSPPPGPVTPTYKTLQEVEPRVAVQSLPGSATAVFVISQPGAYYLAGNVSGVAGKHGIEITASNVSLDLNGFALIGVSGSNDGVRCAIGATTEIDIRNGTVRDWGGSGIYGAGQGKLQDVMAANNHGLYGITMGAHSIITRCTARGNAGFAGIGVAYWSSITDCVSVENEGSGFDAAQGTILRGNVARDNAADGIMVERDCTIENNLLVLNAGAGIRARVLSEQASANRIDSNNCIRNGVGIQVNGAGNTVIRNQAHGNGTNYSVVAGNTFPPVLNPASALTNTNPFANFGE